MRRCYNIRDAYKCIGRVVRLRVRWEDGVLCSGEGTHKRASQLVRLRARLRDDVLQVSRAALLQHSGSISAQDES